MFYEVVLFDQAITRLRGFLYYNVLLNTMILAVAVTVDDAETGAAAKRPSQVFQQDYRSGDLVVGLQYQNGIHAVGRQLRIIRRAENGFHIVESFFLHSIVDVLDRFGIDVDGIHGAVVSRALCCSYREPAGTCADIRDIGS